MGTEDLEDRIEAFVGLLEKLFAASMEYRWDLEASAQRLHEARRLVDAAWAEIDAAMAGEPRQAELRRAAADSRARIGDNLFYDKGDADEAIAEYEGALAFDADSVEALKGIVAAYLQGSDRRPQPLRYDRPIGQSPPGLWRYLDHRICWRL